MKFLIFLLFAAAAGSARPAPVFEDTVAQRTLAGTGWQGRQGRAGPDGHYQRIAGKSAGYRYDQLLNLRDGRRAWRSGPRKASLLAGSPTP